VQGKVEHAPRLPKGINTPHWAPKEGWSIHPSIGTRRNLGDSNDGRRESSKSSRRWPRPASRHGRLARLSHGGVPKLVEVINGMYSVEMI
jgi:hypothetical protein